MAIRCRNHFLYHGGDHKYIVMKGKMELECDDEAIYIPISWIQEIIDIEEHPSK